MYAGEIRKQLTETLFTFKFGTEISREDFERLFTKTRERLEFTFNGWDGKSYNGETRTALIFRTNLPGCENNRFVKVGRSVHMVLEDSAVIEKSTRIAHKGVMWMIDVVRV